MTSFFYASISLKRVCLVNLITYVPMENASLVVPTTLILNFITLTLHITQSGEYF